MGVLSKLLWMNSPSRDLDVRVGGRDEGTSNPRELKVDGLGDAVQVSISNARRHQLDVGGAAGQSDLSRSASGHSEQDTYIRQRNMAAAAVWALAPRCQGALGLL
jgi:hypothetical protein